MELKELARASVTHLRVAWAVLPFSFLRKVVYAASTAYRSVLLLLLPSLFARHKSLYDKWGAIRLSPAVAYY
jgi:hypothetical protein